MRKRRFSPFSTAFFLYLALALLAAALFTGRLTVSTDFTSLLPSNGVPEGMAEAERQLASKLSSRVSMYVAHEDKETAMIAADALRQKAEGLFEEEAEVDLALLWEIYKEHRYQLLTEEIVTELEEDPGLFAEESVERAFAPFTLVPLDNLPNDPFMIDELMARSALPALEGLGFSSGPRELDGLWYVTVQGALKPEHLDFLDSKGGVAMLFKAGEETESEYSVKVYYSGMAFHSFESATSAQRETGLIAIISISLILMLFAILLRSLRVLGLFLLSTACSLLSAFAALVSFFPEIHILTLIFGTTLIGTSIDYAIHFYLSYAREGDAGRTRSRLSRSLSVSFLSTALCYLLLLFSPYALLRQVAVFSAFGLLGSYLTAMGLFPLIVSSRSVNKKAIAWRLPRMGRRPDLLLPLLLVSLLLLFIQHAGLEVHNDISTLYAMSGRMAEGEAVAMKLSGSQSFTYTLIEGEDEEDAREKEALYLEDLSGLKEAGVLQGYLSPGMFVPSPSRQHRSYLAASGLIAYVDMVSDFYGLDEVDVHALESEPETLGFADISLFSSLVPGETGGRYCIAVLLQGVRSSSQVRALDRDGVRYFEKSTDVNRQLDELTHITFGIFIAAVALLAVLLVIFYRKRGLRIAASPLVILSLTLALAPLLNLSIDFFFTVALLLVLGLGLDYMVFASQEGEKPLSAITLSYLTTAMSFGALLFSSFRPVHIFGLTVFIGISVAYLTALASGDRGKKG